MKALSNLDLANQILDGIEQFLGMTTADMQIHFKEHPFDALAMVPHPSGRGSLICGQNAGRCFWQLAKSYLASSPERRKLIDVEEYERCLRHAYVESFLKRGHPLDKHHVSLVLRNSFSQTKRSFKQLTHHIPCSLPHIDDPPSFRIGPVWFRKASRFLEHVPSRTYGGRETSEILREFQWVASVRIPKCHPSVSARHGQFLIAGAMNFLRLMLADHYLADLFTAFSSPAPREVEYLIHVPQCGLTGAGKRIYQAEPLPNDWLRHLRSRLAGFYLPAVEAIRLSRDPASNHDLAARLLDAALWFGEATREPQPAGRIVKYVTALECLTLTPNEKVSRVLPRRASALLAAAHSDDAKSQLAAFKHLYDLRSRIVHGGVTPADPALVTEARTTYELCRKAILAGLLFFDFLGINKENFGHERIQRGYEGLVRQHHQ